MIALAALALFAALLIYAACSDIMSLTIPNWVSIALVAIFLAAAPFGGLSWRDIGIHLLFGFAVLGVGFLLFQANVFGGGDAKLLGAVSVWTGFAGFGEFAIATVMAGGVLALTLLTARKYAPLFAAHHPEFVNRLLTPKMGAPYGVAIMIGGLKAMPVLPIAATALTLL